MSLRDDIKHEIYVGTVRDVAERLEQVVIKDRAEEFISWLERNGFSETAEAVRDVFLKKQT